MRVAVVSPFVDRVHGTERAVAELIERLADRDGDQVHLYSQRVADIKLKTFAQAEQGGGIIWRKVASVPGPHILKFLGWLFLNRWSRRAAVSPEARKPEVTFSPGINAFDADVIQVHAMFHRLAELQVGKDRSGFRGLHRKLYYALVCNLERRIYSNRQILLAAVSQHTADQLKHYFGREDVVVIPYGVDRERFSPSSIAPMRQNTRLTWKCRPDEVVLLLIGNDWRNKGLKVLLEAVARCADLPIRLLIVGQDEQTPFRAEAERLGVSDRVVFCAPMSEVRTFYAAADALVAPSLEDSFNLPVLEAMSCAIPVVVSPRAGVSQWLTHLVDALLLKDPENPEELADAIRLLASDVEKRTTLGRAAFATAGRFSWDTHASDLRKLMARAAELKTQPI